MKCDRRAVLTLTKEEQKTVRSLVNIFLEDRELAIGDVWEIMTGIAEDDNSVLEDYNYTMIVTDR